MRPLTAHPLLRSFNSKVAPLVLRMLEAQRRDSARPPLSAVEQRTWEILTRVDEIDNALRLLRIAIAGVEVEASAPRPDVEQYRYHVENFLLRLTGLYDRACRFVGIVLGLEPQQVERIGGNRVVASTFAALRGHPAKALTELNELFDAYWNRRNLVAHAAEFSNRDLGLFAALARMEVDGVDPVALDALMSAHFAAAALEFDHLVDGAETLLHRLVDEAMATEPSSAADCASDRASV